MQKVKIYEGMVKTSIKMEGYVVKIGEDDIVHGFISDFDDYDGLKVRVAIELMEDD